MSFAAAVAFVLQQEGSQVTESPGDPGGLTKYGISLANHPDLTADQIRNMTPEQARQIYLARYWTPVQGDAWPDKLQLPLLDATVLQGPVTAVKFMQSALYVAVDGKVGPATLGAARNATAGPVLARFTANRIEGFTKDSDWRQAGEGWTTRAVFAALSA